MLKVDYISQDVTHKLADCYSNAPVGSSVARVFIFQCWLITRCWEVHLFRERWCRSHRDYGWCVLFALSRATTRRALDKSARIFSQRTHRLQARRTLIIYCCLRPRDEIALWPISLWRAGASISPYSASLCLVWAAAVTVYAAFLNKSNE
jgi:hypothetical protein